MNKFLGFLIAVFLLWCALMGNGMTWNMAAGWTITISGIALIFMGVFWLPIKIYQCFHKDVENITGTKLSPVTTALLFGNLVNQNKLLNKQLQEDSDKYVARCPPEWHVGP